MCLCEYYTLTSRKVTKIGSNQSTRSMLGCHVHCMVCVNWDLFAIDDIHKFLN